MSSAPNASSSSSALQMPAPAPRPPMRSMAGPSPRLGPAPGPQSDLQFSMDLDDGSSGQPLAPRSSQSEGAQRKTSSDSTSRSRSTGGSRLGSRRDSFDATHERAEKKARISAGGSAGGTPMNISPVIRPASSPAIPSTALVPLDADVQPTSALRDHEFQAGRRVFHVHFGHGYVAALEKQVPQGSSAPAEQERVLSSKTHNIRVLFDNPKYKDLRLRAFYAVPKMVVIPSTAALRKRRKQQMQLLDAPDASLAARIAQVKELLVAEGSLRLACGLVGRWSLQHAFDPAELLRRLLEAKEYAAAVRFAREFKLRKEFPTSALLHSMLEEKRYDGALKACNATCRYVEGDVKPSDVLQAMVRAGQHCVALKYVHKFRMAGSFPPGQLVQACLAAKGELSVRSAGMLLKYVGLFKLDAACPREALLERVAASGIVAHEVAEGKYVLKGRRRSDAPATAVPAPPIKVGSAPAATAVPAPPIKVGSAPG